MYRIWLFDNLSTDIFAPHPKPAKFSIFILKKGGIMKFVLLFAVLYVAHAMYSKKDMVIELDIDNFDTEIAKHAVSMIEFYAPW